MCHITKITSVWRALVDLSKSSVCICSLRISGFAGLTALHLSNPAICICRQVISTLLLEQRWISPKKSFVFSKSNHLHFHSGDIHICQSLLFSSLLINQNSLVQPIFTQLSPSLAAEFGVAFVNKQLKKINISFYEPSLFEIGV